MNLHLESSTKISCCVIPHQTLYVTLHLQSSIKKLSFVTPYTFLFVPRSSPETNRVSVVSSNLVTPPSSRMIPGKLKIEVTKVSIHHVGKNGKHFYGENFIYEDFSKRHTMSNQHMGILHAFSKSNQHMDILHAFSKPNQHMGILHAFSNCVRETCDHGLSPSEVDWVIPKENLQNDQVHIK